MKPISLLFALVGFSVSSCRQSVPDSAANSNRMDSLNSAAKQAHEIIVVVFKSGIGLDEQTATMKQIGINSSKTEGFISRKIFYTEKDNRWIDYIIWRDMAAADASIEDAKAIPGADSLFAKIDQDKSVWSRYHEVQQ